MALSCRMGLSEAPSCPSEAVSKRWRGWLGLAQARTGLARSVAFESDDRGSPVTPSARSCPPAWLSELSTWCRSAGLAPPGLPCPRQPPHPRAYLSPNVGNEGGVGGDNSIPLRKMAMPPVASVLCQGKHRPWRLSTMVNAEPMEPLRGRKNLRLAAALEIVAAAAARDNAPVPFQDWLNKKQRVEHDKGREPGWLWLMLGKDGTVLSDFAQKIRKGPSAGATALVWIVLPQFVKVEDGLLLCSQSTLAKASGVTQPNVNRALKRLTEIGALLAVGDGKYRVHPQLLWFGEYDKQKEAAAKAPPLALGKKRGKLALVETT